MKREAIAPRKDWERTVKNQGMTYYAMGGEPYWTEGHCYRFSHDQINEIQAASQELHGMCLNAVDHVISNDLFHRFEIPENFIPLIKYSWRDQYPYICGRFDLAYDGVNPPKMLEYNTDTPVTMPESAIIQRNWLRDHLRAGTLPQGAAQYNSLSESLIEAWRQVAAQVNIPKPMYFACAFGMENGEVTNQEVYENLQFMRSACEQAGIPTEIIDLPDIGWDNVNFVDLDNRPMESLYKIYPWEWMAVEDFGPYFAENRIAVIEAPWKMIMSSKALLPILWEMYPDHPNLLPTFFTEGKIKGDYVVKPIQGREGANIRIIEAGKITASTDGGYGNDPCIYQAYKRLPNFEGNFPVIGSWVTSQTPEPQTGLTVFARGGRACGMGICEDSTPILSTRCRFVPHYVI